MLTKRLDKISGLEERIYTTIKRIRERIITKKQHVEEFYYYPTNKYKVGSDLPDVKTNGTIFHSNDWWGGIPDAHAWFYKEIYVPKEYERGRIELNITTQEFADDWDAINAQFMVFLNGEFVQGIDTNHRSIVLKQGGTYKVHIYAYCGMKFTVKLNFNVNLHCIDEAVERLFYNLSVPAEVLSLTDDNTLDYIELLNYLNTTLNLLDWRNNNLSKKSVLVANEYIENNFYRLYCGKGTNSNVTVSAVGHTHIDVAWLWTRRQTDEKAQRSFANALALMERYPDYTFLASQPYLYAAVKRESPALYKKIKKSITEGRWEAEGCMWVEPDCNIPSGESLVRQILYGKKFFKDEFGKENKILWLPDVFGYSTALPQILKKSGVEYFVTSKISWNDANKMPNDTFMWQGIDGSEVFTHFITSQEMKRGTICERMVTYNAMGNASYTMGTWNRYINKELSKTALLDYGYGDGGGGSTSDHVENLKRLTYGIPGCPKIKFETLDSFLSNLKKSAKESGRLQKWVGELYLELHRGTYTTQAFMKLNNRRAEFELQNAELYCSMAEILFNIPYPKKKLDKLWEIVLTNQAHDILPGSCIHEVYDVCKTEYNYLFSEIEKIVDNALNALLTKIEIKENEKIVFNPHSFKVSGNAGDEYFEGVPAKGYKVFTAKKRQSAISVDKFKIENKYFLVEFDKFYRIKRCFDKRVQREIFKKNSFGNELIAYEDYPNEFDAWEIRPYYKEKSYPITEIIKVEKYISNISAGLKIIKRYGNSLIEQTVQLYDHIDRIDFVTMCDWQDEHTLLKTYFPLDVNTDKATFDIQFGNYERSTHRNTSWDAAKFEVCSHKYTDVSENDYGVAILTDCKYGFDVEGSTIGLTLLRCPTYPDETADKGKHEFTYSIYPHSGSCRSSDVEKNAYLLNNPLIARVSNNRGGELSKEFSLVSCETDGVFLETIKKAEDGNGYILRGIEKKNMRHIAEIRFGFNVKNVFVCDLMENNLYTIELIEDSVKYEIKPFEILTLRILC